MPGTLNVGDLTPYIEDENVHNEDFGKNPVQEGEFDARQTTRFDVLL